MLLGESKDGSCVWADNTNIFLNGSYEISHVTGSASNKSQVALINLYRETK